MTFLLLASAAASDALPAAANSGTCNFDTAAPAKGNSTSLGRAKKGELDGRAPNDAVDVGDVVGVGVPEDVAEGVVDELANKEGVKDAVGVKERVLDRLEPLVAEGVLDEVGVGVHVLVGVEEGETAVGIAVADELPVRDERADRVACADALEVATEVWVAVVDCVA